MNNGAGYPRPLTSREKAWLDWLLPLNRKGYRDYHRMLEKLLVIGEGRRGKGNYVLGHSSDKPDLVSPLTPVFAYGVIKAAEATVSILTREEAGGQVEIELVPLKGEAIPETLTEKTRWTYSTWTPGNPCPCCSRPLREVQIGSPTLQAVLAICPGDHRIWVYDCQTEVNHLIPVTNFYNELMLHKKVHDPKTVLTPNYFFIHLDSFEDRDLAHAFVVYNKIRKKVSAVIDPPKPKEERKHLTKFMKRMFHQGR